MILFEELVCIRDYNEAMGCFKQAVRLDPENMVLARDLTNLQVHEGNVVR